MTLRKYEYDVFISHAVEDKIDIANELVRKLEDFGIKVWYSSRKLRVGSGADETIKEGLDRSRYGIALFTHNYFQKDWPEKELHTLWPKPGYRVFPVWHKITEEEVSKYDPALVDHYNIDTKQGVDRVVEKLVYCIKGDDENAAMREAVSPVGKIRNKLYVRFGIVFLLAMVLISAWYFL
ncbi:toll/interleukin-1 receptor domain-containing protein [Fulvivirga sp. M361]|uniref:toll/interleukin-1 receptor domain-containing protein n=1 Tax=Fulvivirga sp. M361 TaxID=2594266 RepID=UPI001626492F|nr:toll/interleukin-1 receptor domain-containing protein [Fulvivirga sp. M361]